MGCADGVPRRRYHAWLIAATTPPVGRIVAFHSCAEWLIVRNAGGEEMIGLSAYDFAGGAVRPDPRVRTELVRTSRGVEQRWEIPGIAAVRRTIELNHGWNHARVEYDVEPAGSGVRLILRPFTPLRDFHAMGRESGPALAIKQREGGIIDVRGPAGCVSLRAVSRGIRDPGSGERLVSFRADPQWWRSFEYPFDRERGQDSVEDLPGPGLFECAFGGGHGSMILEAWVRDPSGMDPRRDVNHDGHQAELRAVCVRLDAGRGDAPSSAGSAGSDALASLVHAADQFIVRRGWEQPPAGEGVAPGEGTDAEPQATPGASVIAGYPWFSDWGRDTFISLRGLLITPGRTREAERVLLTFAAMREGGLIPNCFDNGSGKPEYNTVDASLWYLIAACAHARAQGQPLDGEILAACLDIIKAYRDGTAFGIRMDPADGLIAAGDHTTQLTWMDARRDGVVFTPRHGKAVEINALWYAGLLEVASCLPEWYIQSARELPELAEWAGRNFVKSFWNAPARRLYDHLVPRWAAGIIVGWDPVDEIRPNQVFAVSLPHSPLPIAHQRDVLACVKQHLLTPFGLRTLAPGSPGYQPRYEGNLFERDRAYHNGTVWPWLIGPYAEAVQRLGKFSQEARAEALGVLRPLLDELTRERDTPGPIAQLAEIYDAEPPHRPQGCPAQAWSIAEVLRVYALAMEGAPANAQARREQPS